MNVIKRPSTHAEKLERWLGRDQLLNLGAAMSKFYWPIPVSNTPKGNTITAHPGGDFIGTLPRSRWSRLADCLFEKSLLLNPFSAVDSYSDFVARMTGGGARSFNLNKQGTTRVVGCSMSMFRMSGSPTAGAAASAAPGGTVPTDATTGSFTFDNPSVETQHFAGAMIASSAQALFLLYDRIFAVAKTMNSATTEAVSGTPSRYTSTTPGAADFSGGNFAFPECGSALPATAHNWTVMQYTDQGGTTAQTMPSLTGNASCVVNRLDMPLSQWFAGLASNDYGLTALSQMQLSGAVASGAIDWVIGHPIAWIPCPIANVGMPVDGINGPMSLARIFDDACLAFLDVQAASTSATNFGGTFQTVRS